MKKPKRLTVTAVFEHHGDWYVGFVPEVPGVNSQERTLKEARESLKAVLHELAEINPGQLVGTRRTVEKLEIELSAASE